MYTSGEGNDYLLLALADQPVTLAPPANTQTEGPASAGLQEENPGGGVLEITLERESYDGAMPGHTYENAVTLRNAGTAPLTGINLRLDGFGDSGENAMAGAWMDTAGWTVRAMARWSSRRESRFCLMRAWSFDVAGPCPRMRKARRKGLLALGCIAVRSPGRMYARFSG